MALIINVLVAACVLFSVLRYSDADWSEYEEFIKSQAQNETFVKLFQSHLKQFETTSSFTPSKFPCSDYKTPNKATTVHTLSPYDVGVVAALGDSITAGIGINAKTVLGLLIQYRGWSWSIGGDGDVGEVVTLPNILNEYNPNVKGFSTGTGKVDSPNSHLNLAVPGDTSYDIPKQAVDLVNKMRNGEQGVDFENDWKIITLFIGGNDLCSYCKKQDVYSVTNYVSNIRKTLDTLHDTLPKTLVNVVNVFKVTELDLLNAGLICNNLHWILCRCGAFPSDTEREEMQQAVKMYQTKVKELIEDGRYDTRDDFTVVIQPFYDETDVPALSDGSADLSFFAPDCFHLSAKGHKAAAEALWNNMIEPVGRKRKQWSPDEEVECPSADNPYFFTHLNSNSWRFGMEYKDELTNDINTPDPYADESSGSYGGIIIGISMIVSMIAIAMYFLFKKQKNTKETELLLQSEINSQYLKM